MTALPLSLAGERIASLDRRPLLHRVILRALPYAIRRRFDPVAASDLEAVFELRVRDPRGGEPAPFTVTISRGACRVSGGAAREPGATATLGGDDLIRMVSGTTGFPQLVASGSLELGGDPFLALRFPALFGLPAGTAPQPRPPRRRRDGRRARPGALGHHCSPRRRRDGRAR